MRYLLDHKVVGVLVFTLAASAVYAIIDAFPVPEGTQLEFADLTDDFCRDHIGDLVTVEGYLKPDDTMTGCSGPRSSDMHCVIRLSSSPSDGGRSVPVSIEVGSRASQMEALPGVYEAGALQFRDERRNLLGSLDRVRITGKLRSEYCTISVRAIREPLP